METNNTTPNILDDAIIAIQRVKSALNEDNRVMTCGEAAFVLNKTPQTVSRYIAEGKLHRAYARGVNGVWARDVYALLLKFSTH